MDLKRRFGFYGIGFVIGLGLLFFILNGKKASCNFLPNERVLDILRNKKYRISDEVNQIMYSNEIDTTALLSILNGGDVDFSKSQTRTKPCRYYWIDGFINNSNTSIFVENCDTLVTIQKLYLK
jgi:hypothetical protein